MAAEKKNKVTSNSKQKRRGQISDSDDDVHPDTLASEAADLHATQNTPQNHPATIDMDILDGDSPLSSQDSDVDAEDDDDRSELSPSAPQTDLDRALDPGQDSDASNDVKDVHQVAEDNCDDELSSLASADQVIDALGINNGHRRKRTSSYTGQPAKRARLMQDPLPEEDEEEDEDDDGGSTNAGDHPNEQDLQEEPYSEDVVPLTPSRRPRTASIMGKRPSLINPQQSQTAFENLQESNELMEDDPLNALAAAAIATEDTEDHEVADMVQEIADNEAADQDEPEEEEEETQVASRAVSPGQVEVDERDEQGQRRADALQHLTRIEIAFAKLKDRIYREKVAELDKEIVLIKEGTHPQLSSLSEEIEAKRRKRLRLAQTRKNYSEEQVETCFDALEYQSWKTYTSQRQILRRRMMEKVNSQIYQLEREYKELINMPTTLKNIPTDRYSALRQARDMRVDAAIYDDMTRHHGFPAAPKLDSAVKTELDSDLQAMGLREPQPALYQPVSQQQQPQTLRQPYMPPPPATSQPSWQRNYAPMSSSYSSMSHFGYKGGAPPPPPPSAAPPRMPSPGLARGSTSSPNMIASFLQGPPPPSHGSQSMNHIILPPLPPAPMHGGSMGSMGMRPTSPTASRHSLPLGSTPPPPPVSGPMESHHHGSNAPASSAAAAHHHHRPHHVHHGHHHHHPAPQHHHHHHHKQSPPPLTSSIPPSRQQQQPQQGQQQQQQQPTSSGYSLPMPYDQRWREGDAPPAPAQQNGDESLADNKVRIAVK